VLSNFTSNPLPFSEGITQVICGIKWNSVYQTTDFYTILSHDTQPGY
jgi:hypothetical protein